jgi:hypothetical protein
MWCWSRRNDISRRARRTRRATFFPACSAVSACVVCSVATPTYAQSVERITADTVVSVDVFGGENVSNQPQVIIDPSAAVRIDDHWRIIVRPWFRLPRPTTPNGATPDWDVELYEGGVRYERPGAVAMRLDAGYFASPIGLGILDWRPSNNPTIVPHLSYAVPLLPFDPTIGARPSTVANSYPLMGQLTLSTTKWDARAAMLNSSPTRPYVLGNTSTNPQQTPNVVLGGGVTPVTGLRLGVSFAHGVYATREEQTGAAAVDRDATIVGGEGEFAFGYTSLRGELLHTTFDTSTGSAGATEWFLQGVQILSPRWFGAARVEHVSGPTSTIGPAVRTDLDMVETTAGFRVTPEFTLRASYYARRFYAASAWDHQVGASIVWAKRWW